MPPWDTAGDSILIAMEILFVSLLGLALGSFTTAITYRIPRRIPWAFATRSARAETAISAYRSVCTHCKNALAVRDLVPVLSWLFLRGRCRHCRAPIGTSYLWIEIAVLALCLAVYAAHGLSVSAGFLIAAVPFLVALLVIDLQFLILPNQLIAILAVLGLAYRAFALWQDLPYASHPWIWNLTEYMGGALAYGGLIWALGAGMSIILKKDALGFGDVKFFVLAGLWLGLSQLPVYFMLCGVFGVVFGLLWRWSGRADAFPFGPALIAAFLTLLLFGGSIFPQIALQ